QVEQQLLPPRHQRESAINTQSRRSRPADICKPSRTSASQIHVTQRVQSAWRELAGSSVVAMANAEVIRYLTPMLSNHITMLICWDLPSTTASPSRKKEVRRSASRRIISTRI